MNPTMILIVSKHRKRVTEMFNPSQHFPYFITIKFFKKVLFVVEFVLKTLYSIILPVKAIVNRNKTFKNFY